MSELQNKTRNAHTKQNKLRYPRLLSHLREGKGPSVGSEAFVLLAESLVDAVQDLGRLSVDKIGIADLMIHSGHHIYGQSPKPCFLFKATAPMLLILPVVRAGRQSPDLRGISHFPFSYWARAAGGSGSKTVSFSRILFTRYLLLRYSAPPLGCFIDQITYC